MTLEERFLDQWDDGNGMPWLTITPWKPGKGDEVTA